MQLADRLHCTGCAACTNSCSHQAISMQMDDEGFLQPYIDTDKCIECGLCVQRCPILTPINREPSKQEVYALISYKDRTLSSSGGAFSVIARYVLQQGGVVFGASMDTNLYIKHIAIEQEKDLPLLRGSKYVQSNIGNSYKEVKKYIFTGRLVLFTGTPCQVAGLYAYLGNKKYEKQLITLDLVCHGVPSQGAFDAYLEKLKKSPRLKGGNIEGFRFRNFDSWSIVPAVKIAESKWQILNLWENAYMDAFFEGITFRESCFRCNYCNTQRVGTMTIADFWGIGRHGKQFKKNVACGVSLVIDNHNLMPTIYAELTLQAYIEKRNMEEAVAEQTNLKAPMPRPSIRDKAIKMLIDPDISLKEFAKTCGLRWKLTPKYFIIKLMKDCIYAFGLYNVYKTIIYKLGKS